MIDKANILKNYTSDTANSIVEIFYNDLVSKEDQQLLELAFAKKIEQSQLNEFLKTWDIEKFGEGKSMMLSYVMKANPQLQFSIYEKPRLEGLLKYHRFHNLKLISHYTKIVRALNSQNIIPLIFKGGAMKHIRPDLSRAMGDIDILVKNEAEFLRACAISKNLGYIFDESEDHSVDLHLPNSKEGTVDIHRYICFETNYDKKFLNDLFVRATQEKVFGAQAFVPCFEDILFLGMINLARNLNNKTSLQGILYALFDFKYLTESKADFNWDLVLQNIVRTKTYAPALLAMKFTNKIIPEMLPQSLLENDSINKKFMSYCNRIIFHHFYFNDFRQRHKHLNIKDAVKNLEKMKNYLTNKPKYFLLKRMVRKSDFLIKTFLILSSKKQVRI